MGKKRWVLIAILVAVFSWTGIAVLEQFNMARPETQDTSDLTANVVEALSPTTDTFLPVVVKQPTPTHAPTAVPT